MGSRCFGCSGATSEGERGLGTGAAAFLGREGGFGTSGCCGCGSGLGCLGGGLGLGPCSSCRWCRGERRCCEIGAGGCCCRCWHCDSGDEAGN